MNETSYARTLIARTISIIVYIVFIIDFIVLGIKMFITKTTSLIGVLALVLVLFIGTRQIIRSIKSINLVIKDIKEKKKFNLYVRNIGDIICGLSAATWIINYFLKFISIKIDTIFLKITIFGIIIGIIIIIIDKILEALKISNIILEIDKSDE